VKQSEVLFVVMPFCNVHMPALGVSLLKAELAQIGISAQIHYFNLKFAERIGLDLYDRIAETEFPSELLMGEMIFAKSVFGGSLPRSSRYIRRVLQKTLDSKKDPKYLKNVEKEILRVEELIPAFIEKSAEKVLLERPRLVGFTSTFHQNCAALLLARAIKNMANVPIIFGGANCEGEMGWTLLNCFHWVDFVCSGEGDIAFVEFMKSFLKGESRQKIAGIISRGSNTIDVSLTNPVMNLDNLPIPDFDDYFAALGESPVIKSGARSIVTESSRGCWWGEKSQCTFCGLNGSTMKYRSKTVSRALEELAYLRKRYKTRRFHLTDNILDLKYTDSLFPEILQRGLNVDLFYETKSNLTRNQLIAMKQAGVSEIQPGIESLSDTILTIMKKGVCALQNIQLLKWCIELEIIPYWNILWGFPGEPEEEYVKMARLVPLLTHLPPPQWFGKIVLDRFSPYYFEPFKHGLVNVRPSISYTYVYPFSEDRLKKIAYHFDFDYSDDRDVDSYTKMLRLQIRKWKRLWTGQRTPSLNMVRVDNLILINDTRPISIQEFYILRDEEARIYEFCDIPQTLRSITSRINDEFSQTTEEAVMNIICDLVDRKLLLDDNGKYLNLAIPVRLMSA